MDGENAGPGEFKGKLSSIQKDADAIFFRRRELEERPAAVKRAKAYIQDTKEVRPRLPPPRVRTAPCCSHGLHLPSVGSWDQCFVQFVACGTI